MNYHIHGKILTVKCFKYKENHDGLNKNIIAITAGLSDKIKKQCFNIGMKGYIAKPIDKSDLEKILQIFNQ